jgi:hypothetical protein
MDIAAVYDGITSAIQNETGASDSLLHVHAGMAVLLVARVLTGKSLATPVPFLIVCVAAVINEGFDRLNHIVWRPTDAALDLVNTLFWPLVLMIGLRLRRARQQRPAVQKAEAR